MLTHQNIFLPDTVINSSGIINHKVQSLSFLVVSFYVRFVQYHLVWELGAIGQHYTVDTCVCNWCNCLLKYQTVFRNSLGHSKYLKLAFSFDLEKNLAVISFIKLWIFCWIRWTASIFDEEKFWQQMEN